MSISIITTVLNNEKFIYDCVNSVRNQKFTQDYEHIVVDGGSKDNTLKILRELKKNNKNLKIYEKKNMGIYQGINYAIKKTKYKYIGLLHADDFYKNNKVFKNILNEFRLNNKLLSIHSNIEFVKRNNKKKIVRFFKSEYLESEDFINCKHPPHTSLFVDKKIFNDFGLYNINLKIASDFEFMLRVYGVNKIYSKYVNKTFVVMRAGGISNKNIFNILLSNYEVYKSFKINNLSVNIFLILKKILSKVSQVNF
tara:strand:+ start:2626 stop:3384 length:759 start_codon:yes stop_codon:yes gene_type:complete